MEELFIEQAIAREALRLSFKQHKEFAVGLKGIQKERTISDAFDQSTSGETLVNMMDLDLLVGSGGVLSHAPRREQSAKMLIDSFMPEGITQLAVDSIFMMPQLGVLAGIDKQDLKDEAKSAALEVFHNDCLIRLGTCINPIGKAKKGDLLLTAQITIDNQKTENIKLYKDDFLRIEAPYKEINIKLNPEKNMDIGAGPNQEINTIIYGGTVGLIFDGRSRPIDIPLDSEKRLQSLKKWSEAINEYPKYNI
tara:strand:- start:34 stop:786 length:753 start_codon:yes stop_codon:yes gene_type:complete